MHAVGFEANCPLDLNMICASGGHRSPKSVFADVAVPTNPLLVTCPLTHKSHPLMVICRHAVEDTIAIIVMLAYRMSRTAEQFS